MKIVRKRMRGDDYGDSGKMLNGSEVEDHTHSEDLLLWC